MQKPTKKLDKYDSFDEYVPPAEDENAWKYANVPVKKKSEREKLKGFSCDDCESYYRLFFCRITKKFLLLRHFPALQIPYCVYRIGDI